MLTPLLLVGNVLCEDKPQLNRHIREIGAGKLRFDGGCQKNGVDWRSDQEEQDALDERNEGPVEDVEHGFGDLLPDDLPLAGVSAYFICEVSATCHL